MRDVTVLLGDPRLPDATKPGGRFMAEDLDAVLRLKAALAELTASDGWRFRYLDDHTTLLDELRREPPELVLNCCDTGFRNVAASEPLLPAYLELLGIPYSGCPAVCLGLCYDKALVRAVALAHGVPVPRQLWMAEPDPDLLPAELDFPVLIKPNRADGSVGITQRSVAKARDEAHAVLQSLGREWPGRGALVQEFLSGTEYGLGLIGNPGHGFTALPALEVDYTALDAGLPHVLGYESKTVPDSPYWTKVRYQPAQLTPQQHQRIVAAAELLFERLGCRDYARFDFRADRDGEIKLLEVNPNPAWCWDGKLNMMATFAGHSYSGLLRLLLQAAIARTSGSVDDRGR